MIERVDWSPLGPMGPDMRPERPRFGTMNSGQMVTLVDFDTLTYTIRFHALCTEDGKQFRQFP